MMTCGCGLRSGAPNAAHHQGNQRISNRTWAPNCDNHLQPLSSTRCAHFFGLELYIHTMQMLHDILCWRQVRKKPMTYNIWTFSLASVVFSHSKRGGKPIFRWWTMVWMILHDDYAMDSQRLVGSWSPSIKWTFIKRIWKPPGPHRISPRLILGPQSLDIQAWFVKPEAWICWYFSRPRYLPEYKHLFVGQCIHGRTSVLLRGRASGLICVSVYCTSCPMYTVGIS